MCRLSRKVDYTDCIYAVCVCRRLFSRGLYNDLDAKSETTADEAVESGRFDYAEEMPRARGNKIVI